MDVSEMTMGEVEEIISRMGRFCGVPQLAQAGGRLELRV